MTDDRVQRQEEILSRFSYLPVGVVGDLVAEIFLSGIPDRLSREAPVLVLRHDGQTLLPGGAAYVATVLGGLGARVHLIGIVGDDEAFTISLAIGITVIYGGVAVASRQREPSSRRSSLPIDERGSSSTISTRVGSL